MTTAIRSAPSCGTGLTLRYVDTRSIIYQLSYPRPFSCFFGRAASYHYDKIRQRLMLLAYAWLLSKKWLIGPRNSAPKALRVKTKVDAYSCFNMFEISLVCSTTSSIMITINLSNKPLLSVCHTRILIGVKIWIGSRATCLTVMTLRIKLIVSRGPKKAGTDINIYPDMFTSKTNMS